MPYLKQHTQNSRGFPIIAVPYLEYPTQDRKATRVGPLHQMPLSRMRLSLVPYLKYPTWNSHALLNITCYSKLCSSQKPYLGCCTALPGLEGVDTDPKRRFVSFKICYSL